MTYASQLAFALTMASAIASATTPADNLTDDWRLASQASFTANYVSRVSRSGDVAMFRWLQVNERSGAFWVAAFSLECKTSKLILQSFQWAANAEKGKTEPELTPEMRTQLETLVGSAPLLKNGLCSPEFDKRKADARTVGEALAFARKETSEFRDRLANANEKTLVSNEDGNRSFYQPPMAGLPRRKVGDTWGVTKENSTPNHDRSRWRHYFLVAGRGEGMAITMRSQSGNAPFPLGTICRATKGGEPNAERVRSRHTDVSGGPIVKLNFYFKSTQDYVCSIRLLTAGTAAAGSTEDLTGPPAYVVELGPIEYGM